jgi:large subunit ribosomal protein L13
MNTYGAKEEEIKRSWYLVDAQGKIVGRLASNIASLLRGKHKPIFTPYVDTGDFVVVVNAQKAVLSGKKLKEKIYWHHSGYPGGIKSITAEKLLAKKPEELLRHAVKGMLPKNRLGRKMIKKLKVYAGKSHPHQAQKPAPLEI